MHRLYYILFLVFLSLTALAQNTSDPLLKKITEKDSIRNNKVQKSLESHAITSEIHNLFFRNIYQAKNYNEEEEFKRKFEYLKQFNGKIIDTIILRQFEVFGENIYDTLQKGSKLEQFLSNSTHVNTKQRVIMNRYLLMDIGDVFSVEDAMENTRLIRSAGIFHDVRIIATPSSKDPNKITIYFYIQDVFAYGFGFTPNSTSSARFGLDNINIMGWGHQISTSFNLQKDDTVKPFGYGVSYTIPNIFNKHFINLKLHLNDFKYNLNMGFELSRTFSRPEFRWAGGVSSEYKEVTQFTLNNVTIRNTKNESDLWYSFAFPLKKSHQTFNSIVLGARYSKKINFDRPPVDPNSNITFWNNDLILGSIGYSRVKYVQDRLINGFGRTEDIPTGISINGLYGYELSEFGKRNYFGGQLLTQFYNDNGTYVNIGAKVGFFQEDLHPSLGVIDFNFQAVSRTFKIGKIRLRNFWNSRYTIGLNRDETEYISFSEYNGIRGLNNSAIQGNQRVNFGLQNNIYLPYTVLGFRFYVFTLFEIAQMVKARQVLFDSPINTGVTMGVAFKNENMIFDVIQIQYGYYQSTSDLYTNKGILITSIIPFKFQGLDISKPNVLEYR